MANIFNQVMKANAKAGRKVRVWRTVKRQAIAPAHVRIEPIHPTAGDGKTSNTYNPS